MHWPMEEAKKIKLAKNTTERTGVRTKEAGMLKHWGKRQKGKFETDRSQLPLQSRISLANCGRGYKLGLQTQYPVGRHVLFDPHSVGLHSFSNIF